MEEQPPSHSHGFQSGLGLALYTLIMFAPVAKTVRNNGSCIVSPRVKTSIRPH